MAMRITVVAGLPLWWLLGATLYGRKPMGTFGPIIFGFAFLVLVLLVVGGRCRRALPHEVGDRPRPGVLEALFVWACVLLGVALATWFVDLVFVRWLASGIGSEAVWAFAGFSVLVLTPFVLPALVHGMRRRHDRGLGAASVPPAAEVVSVLLVLLCPLLALLLARDASFASPWDVAALPPSAAGILYYALFALAWPAAIPVAYALDRLDGSSGRPLARGVVRTAFGVLGLATLVGPWLLLALERTDEQTSVLEVLMPWGILVGTLRSRHPFSVGRGGGDLGQLPVEPLLFGACVLAFVVTAFVTWRLAHLARTRRGGVHVTSLLALVGVQVALTGVLAPWLGPAAAAWAAVVGVLAAAGVEGLFARGAGRPAPRASLRSAGRSTNDRA